MGSQLHQALRSLCCNTGWNYAVFWKLKHQASMMLTWEDAYYDNHRQHGPAENNWRSDAAGNSCDRQFSHDSLGLAVAKMSYHVYSLGEGIVGQVAITNKHLWISADKHVTDCFLFRYCDAWLTQFSAGIRTIAVVAVVPHGVVQLGSLNNIVEDLMLVNQIRDVFFGLFGLQDPLAGGISSLDCSSCLSNASCRSSASRNYHDCVRTLDKNMKNERKPLCRSSVVPLPEGCLRKTVMIDRHEEPEYSVSGVGESSDLLQSSSIERLQEVNGKLAINRKFERENRSSFRDVGMGSRDHDASSLNFLSNNSNLSNVKLTAGNYGIDTSYLPSVFCGTAPTIDQMVLLGVPEISLTESETDLIRTLEFQNESNYMDTSKACFKFSAGCELYEALGPAFKKQNTSCDWETQKTETGTVVQINDEGMCSSNLLSVNPGAEHLLEAMVANVCQSVSDVKCENTISGSVTSFLTAKEVLEPPTSDVYTICSAGYSFDQSSLVAENTLNCLPSSRACGIRSSNGFSSRSHSKCSEQIDKPQELDKINKKRARLGENCRPRPRDRQLIQDRIKELRELVPNGSKCSIDSLLERTIKHMLFMQCTTQHADKLDKCAESKLLEKETSVRGSSSYEQGSTWAMEVGSQLGVFPIMVENINMSGQMLVEMLCEDCGHFFEIAEAIRSLGLTILKGATEAYCGKIWIRFVVEGQNNRNMHRMDILWSLVQILQPKPEV